MQTISKIETPLPSIGRVAGNGEGGGLVGQAARAAASAFPGFTRVEFFSQMDPYERAEWAERLAANRQWLIRVLNPALETTSTELTTTVKAVFAVLARFGAGAINLTQLTDHVNGVHLAVVLRSTADELRHTEGWQRALALAQEVLIRQGVDPQDALMGMIPRQ